MKEFITCPKCDIIWNNAEYIECPMCEIGRIAFSGRWDVSFSLMDIQDVFNRRNKTYINNFTY